MEWLFRNWNASDMHKECLLPRELLNISEVTREMKPKLLMETGIFNKNFLFNTLHVHQKIKWKTI